MIKVFRRELRKCVVIPAVPCQCCWRLELFRCLLLAPNGACLALCVEFAAAHGVVFAATTISSELTRHLQRHEREDTMEKQPPSV